MDKDIETFCKDYFVEKINIEYKSNRLSQLGISVSIGATCEIEMPYEQFLKIAEMHKEATKLLSRQAKEKELQELYPAVKKAGDEYNLLLTITQKEEK